MADHSKPVLTDNYTDVLSQIRGRLDDQAKQFDPALTSYTNIQTGTIRWDSASSKDQKWNGTAWVDKSSNYSFNQITLTGGVANGVAYLNASKVLTSGSALTFDGTTLALPRISQSGSGSYGTFNSTGAGNAFAGYSYNGSNIGFIGQGSGILSGGNNTDFGIRAESNLVFGISFNEQMRLTSTGLGIGTSSPGYKLDVRGNVASSNGTVATGLSWDTNGLVGTFTNHSLGIMTNSSVVARFDSAGNFGLGVTPSAWGSSYKVYETPAGFIGATGTNYLFVGSNCYADAGGFKYKNTAATTLFEAGVDAFKWRIAPSGTAGNAISFTQAMTLDASGNLLVGNTNGTSKITASGVVESTTGGFKFPDGTTQTTAMSTVAGGVGSHAMLVNNTTSDFTAGHDFTTTSTTQFYFSSAKGVNGLAVGSGQTWRCLGSANGVTISPSDGPARTTLWLRIS